MTAGERVLGRRTLRTVGITAAVLILIILVSAGIRLIEDLPPIVAGTLPDDDYAVRYVRHHVLAYLHIMFGIIYLLGAPLQLSQRFRSRNYPRHRRLGRGLLSAGLLSGVFALLAACPTPSAASGRPPPPPSSGCGSSPAYCLRSARSRRGTWWRTGGG